MANRLLALDGLRGALALYVLAGHTTPFLDLPPALAALRPALSHGHAAVALFFILSGLVILGSIARAASQPRPVAHFLLARAVRLLPVYGIALVLAAIALGLGNPFPDMPWLLADSPAHQMMESGWPADWPGHLASHALLLQGLLPPALLPDATFSILGPAWSLSTEWQFYVLAALALATCGRRVTEPAHLRVWVIALLLLGVLGLAMAALPPSWQAGRGFLPCESWFFALGIASFAQQNPHTASIRTRIVFAATLVAACVMSGIETRWATGLAPLIWAVILGCQNPGWAPLAARPLLHLGQRLLTTPVLLWVGRLSYPLYLTHAPVQRMLMLWLAPQAGGDWGRFTLSFVGPAIALPLLVALILHHSLEKPLRLRPMLSASASNTSAAGPL